jgi:hypothetical protein
MKRTLVIIMVTIASIALTAGAVNAASTFFDSLTVGRQGVGGVTQLNGSVLNNTTTNGVDNPLTIADNLRIDGRVYRGATAGPGDGKPLLINDDMAVAGSITVDGDTVAVKKLYSGTIDLTKNGDEITTSAVAFGALPPPTYQSLGCTYRYHFKKIAVSEVTTANLPNIKVNTRIDAAHQVGYYPTVSTSWIGGVYSLSAGYVHLLYKAVLSGCGTSTAYYTTGKYQINVVY